MVYDNPGGGALDYRMCRYGMSRLLFRGPLAPLTRPYTLFLGGTATFGRFVPRPFPALAGAEIGIATVNMGLVNAGLDAFVGDETVLDAVARAETVVIEILGAQNLSNRFYAVHPRRNDRFLGATDALKALYPEVDFTEFAFTRHLLTRLEHRDPHRFLQVVEALQSCWAAQMERLMQAAGDRAVLLWLADAPPPQEARSIVDGMDPLFVDVTMTARLAARAEQMVCVTPSRAAIAAGTRGMVFSEFEASVAAATAGPAIHAEVAEALCPVLQRMNAAAA